ncbi:hypothetical protein QTP70_009666 [Hemibagrus guttatus]|uniref:Uncharacterized protein n=1 Tax=Hemibagrus guttatus TaxID=175788 RepID=A0AAE0UZG0_9TELE|nr:hypothetical protein QTP70_009666 [Hemibagrus guttatus]
MFLVQYTVLILLCSQLSSSPGTSLTSLCRSSPCSLSVTTLITVPSALTHKRKHGTSVIKLSSFMCTTALLNQHEAGGSDPSKLHSQGRYSGPTDPHNNLANVLHRMPFLTQPSHFSGLGTGTASSGWGLNPLPFDPATNNEPLQFNNSNGPLVSECPLESSTENGSKKRKRSNLPPASYPVATKSSPSLHPIDYCILSYGDHSFSCKVIFPSGPHSVSQQLTELRMDSSGVQLGLTCSRCNDKVLDCTAILCRNPIGICLA